MSKVYSKTKNFLTAITRANNKNSKTRNDYFIELFGINVKIVNKMCFIYTLTRKNTFCRREKCHQVSLRWKQIAFQQHNHYYRSNRYITNMWLLVFVLNNALILGIWCSTIPHLTGCFCPWTFFQNIGFTMVPSDPFMSHLATQLGYSAGEFQVLQLIVLAAFGVVD